MCKIFLRLVKMGSKQSSSSKNDLASDKIWVEEIKVAGKDRKRQFQDKKVCDVCLVNDSIANLSKSFAFYLCYVCEKYMCENCYKGHDESHECITLLSEEREKETRRRGVLGKMRKESERKEKFEREKVSMVDRVNVKHGLDKKDCWITGLCGLDETRWVVSDYSNSCIKIFNVGSNLLQRCVRLSFRPWDVTEIKGKRESTEQATNQGKQDEQILIAVTLPLIRGICILNVTPNPAVITKTVNTEKQCWSIEFSDDHLFTLCRGDDGYGPLFISVISIGGVEVKIINTGVQLDSYLSYLAVCSGRFYITDPSNSKVLCLNDEGKEVWHKTIEGLSPYGISVDPDTNHLYICDTSHHKVLRLDSGLEGSDTFFDLESVNSEMPFALCLHRDKLYVGHWGFSHTFFVIVVRVL